MKNLKTFEDFVNESVDENYTEYPLKYYRCN